MTTDRFYNKRFLIYKAVYAVLLPTFTELFAMLFDTKNPLVYVFLVMFFMGLFYSVPFITSVNLIKKEKVVSIKKFVLLDFAYLLFPVIISVVVNDSVFSVMSSDTKGLGFFSVLAIPVLTFITLSLWTVYSIVKKK